MAVNHRGMNTVQKKEPSPRRHAAVLLYLLFAGILVFAAATLFVTVSRAPARERSAELPGVGTIQVVLRLAPDPPKVGRIPFTLTATSGDGRVPPVDGMSASYGSVGYADRPVPLVRIGPGTYEGVLEFPAVGDWWLRVVVARGRQTVEVQFPIRVVPNL